MDPQKSAMRRIAILGSTGSIGRSTLSVAESYPERFQVVALAAGANLDAAFEQACRWQPRVVSVAAESDAEFCVPGSKARATRSKSSTALPERCAWLRIRKSTSW